MATTPPTQKLTLKILFWNSRSISQRSKDIESIIKNCDIFVCVESWLTKNDNIYFPGMIIFIRKNLSFVELENLYSPNESVEICGLNFDKIEPNLGLIVCYRPPSNFTQNEWNTIVSNVKDKSCIVFFWEISMLETLFGIAHSPTPMVNFLKMLQKPNIYFFILIILVRILIFIEIIDPI